MPDQTQSQKRQKTMSTQINDGGPAFPRTEIVSIGGMSLRDYFAGQALAGSLASQTPESHWSFAALPEETTNDNAKNGIARLCYDIADAMIKAREVKP
jgi:hypothetical protein